LKCYFNICLKADSMLFVPLNKLMLAIKIKKENINGGVMPEGISSSVGKQYNFFPLQDWD